MTTVEEQYAQLTEQQSALETEIGLIVEELTSGAQSPGLKGPLVDADGFPRADIDVYRVRHLRHQFACLQNDHRALMKRIEEILPQVFEAKQRARTGAQTKSSASEKPTPPPKQPVQVQAAAAAVTPQSDHIDALLLSKQPFATVANVHEDSPAEWAGLRSDDQVLVFGSADASNHRNLEAVKEIVGRNIGQVIRVVVRRRTTQEQTPWTAHELSLTPQQWTGAGVLGCLLTPTP